MTIWRASIPILFLFAGACSGRTDNVGSDSGTVDGQSLDSGEGEIDASSPQCAPQSTTPCSDDCVSTIGAYWDGSFCQPIICCCEGPDCDETYATVDECLASRSTCNSNACAGAGGYCNYGDLAQPECALGYGSNDALSLANPGVCGFGVCCTWCPEPEDPRVHYVAEDPLSCGDIDFECQSTQTGFDNECGCGCIDAAPAGS